MQKGSSTIFIIIGAIVLIAIISGAFYLGRLTLPKTPADTQSIENKQQTNNSSTVTQTESKNINKLTYLRDGDIIVFDLKTNQEKKITNHGYNTSPIFSPDNLKISYLSIPDAVVKSGKVQKFSGSGLFDQPISYAGEYNVWIINADGSNPIQVTKDAKKRKSIAWSAESRKISFEEDGQIIEYDLNSKNTTALGEGTDPIYSPNGSGRAFVFDNEKTLQIFNNKGGQAYTHKQSINDLNWSDKDKILFTSVSKTNGPTYQWKFSIWVYPVDGKPHQITQEEDRIHSPVISPNESYIATSKGSGYADAGNIDLTLVVLKLNNDLTVARQIRLDEFKGPDFFEKEKQFMFPTGNAVWLNEKEFVIQLDALVNPQPNPRGLYKLNVENLSAERLLEL